MGRLGNQVWQVLLTYATHRPNWFWFGGFALWLGFGLLMGTSGEASVEDREDGRMPWITLLFSSLWLANVMTVQTTQQFMHYRARLMPRFALAHSLVPLAIAMVAGLGVPAIFAYAQNTSLLPMAAFSSALFAAVFASVSTTTYSWLLFLAIIGPMFFGYSLWDIHVNLSPSISVAVLAGAWLGIAYSLVRLATIGEEDRSYERLIGWSGRSHTKPTRSTDLYDQPSSFGVWQSSSVRWQIADYWHDRIGSFHEGRPIRIIRLLRHGYGATPPELHALGTPIFLLAISLLLTFVEESEDVIDPLATIRLLPILAAVFFPAALAIDRLPQRRPFLPAEIMLPLSRETLIDSLLGAAAWNLALVLNQAKVCYV